jgi:hypothetical protein
MLNASPKLRALIQKFEGSTAESDDFANQFIGNTRAMTPTRRGSGSSDLVKVDYSSLWSNCSASSSRPGTPGSFTEFGEKLMMERLIERDILNGDAEQSYTDDRSIKSVDNGSQWDLRHITTANNSSSFITSR